MRPQCSANKTADFKHHICSLPHGHIANHRDTYTGYSWPDSWASAKYVYGVDEFLETEEPEPEQGVSVLLTVEELKALTYAIAGEDWREDEPELVAKIEKALKDAL